jgi:putative radical SAM enzyme (TIGR03279 family)
MLASPWQRKPDGSWGFSAQGRSKPARSLPLRRQGAGMTNVENALIFNKIDSPEKNYMVTIVNIVPGSIAEELGIRSGDQLLTINRQEINDYIDYRYHNAGEALEMAVKRGEETIIFEIEKEYDEDVGIEPEEMKMMNCGNNCIFCFVHQNPKGLRRPLYFKDEDYRFSFLYGHYVTLTRVDEPELKRIVEQNLSPLYVSVHATEWQVRKLLLGLKKDDLLLKKLGYLTKHGIEVHTQIVLCPGINDGAVLDNTINDLAGFYPGIGSIAIVPVGLTRHRERLHPLRQLTRDEMRETVTYVKKRQQMYREEIGTGFVYLSDEFFIQAIIPLPGKAYYDDFYQIENGVGEFRDTIDMFNHDWPGMFKSLKKPVKITWVTGYLAYDSLQQYIISKLNTIDKLTIQLRSIENKFYGSSITVSGLLVGGDIHQQISGSDLGDLVLLPPRILNANGLMLDDWTPAMLQEKTGVPCYVYTEPLSELVKVVNKVL